MRLIDAELLNNFIDKWLSKKCDEHGNTTPNKWLNSLKRCVKNSKQPMTLTRLLMNWNNLQILQMIICMKAILTEKKMV